MNIAIIVAAGKGKRMQQKQNKIFINAQNKPIIFYTISAFEKCKKINGIVIVTRKYDIAKLKSIIKQYNFKKVINVILGGQERQESSYKGLKYLQTKNIKKNDIILIHNGANPLIDQKTILNIISAVKINNAAVCGFPVKDTIKKIHNNFILETLDRKTLWQIQTPQAAKFDLFIKAFEKAKKDKFLGTDDVMLIERLGKKVKIIECPKTNIKLTFPEDLEIINQQLRKLYAI